MSRYSTQDIGGLFRSQVAAVLAYTSATAHRMGLGASEMAALEHLQGAGELTPGQLGRRLAMTSGAVTALVDRLQAAGYVERVPNPLDRRSSIVRPTSGADEEGMRHLGGLAAEILRITEELSEEERDAVGRYLEAVTAAISRQSDG